MLDQLGAMFAPQVQAQPTPDPTVKAEWDGWLADPANRAGLLSFGLQAMTGGWGGAGQQLAQALGAGVEGYSGAQKIQQDTELAERQRNDAAGEKDADRQLRRDLNREDNDAAMARTRLSSGDQRTAQREDRAWQSAFNATKNRLEAQNIAMQKKIADAQAVGMDTAGYQMLSPDDIIAQAGDMADRTVAARGKRGQGDTGDITSGITGNGGESVGSVGGKKDAATGQNSAAVVKDAALYANDPKVQAARKDPAQWKHLQSKGWVDSRGELPDPMAGASIVRETMFMTQYKMPDGTIKNVPKAVATGGGATK